MKVLWKSDKTGRSGILVESEGYDGTPPISELWLDRSPLSLHADRVAIAGALVFGAYAASGLEFSRPVSTGVAEAIKLFCGNEGLNIMPVDYEQRPFARGHGKLDILEEGIGVGIGGHSAVRRRMTLNVLRSDVYSGSIMSSNSLSVSSNSYLHDGLARGRGRAGYGALAVGVLFAEDLGLDTCSYPLPLPTLVSELLIAGGLRTA